MIRARLLGAGIAAALLLTGCTGTTGTTGESTVGGSAAAVSRAADGSTEAASGGPSAAAAFDPKAIDPLPVPTPTLPATVTGADGSTVTVTSVDRVVAVSQSGSVAEIVATLGLGDALVGRDIAATFHGIEDVPVVTQGHDLATEPILALNPTLVLTDESGGPATVLDQLRAAGVPVVIVPDAWSLAEIGPRIRAVATALGVPAAGDQLVARTEAEIAAASTVRPADAPIPRIAFLYLRGTAGVYLMAGRGSGADAMIAAIGGQDAGTAIDIENFRPLTSEGLILAAPDVLLLMSDGLESVGGIDGLLKVPGIAQTPAGAQRRVVTMDDGALLSFGPRTGAVLLALADLVYGGDGTG